MKLTKRKEGQGATEYLLILAAVLVVVAIAVYYVTRGVATKPNILLSAQKDGTSIKLVATGGTDSCPAADWQYTVHDNATTETWTAGTAVLSSTTNITLASGLTAGTTYTVRVQHIPSGQYFVPDATITI